jgi:hypothetical protein
MHSIISHQIKGKNKWDFILYIKISKKTNNCFFTFYVLAFIVQIMSALYTSGLQSWLRVMSCGGARE